MTDSTSRFIDIDRLRDLIEAGEIDTVVLAFTDMQGRLQGKRLHGRYFLDVASAHGTEGCDYLLGVDVDMNTVDGYSITSWEQGYGDMEFVLDFGTIRLLPHLPATAMVQCDVAGSDHRPVPQSPRTILRAQADRAAAAGFRALAGTELEFLVFDTTYEQAWDGGYRSLIPVSRYNADYSIVATSRVEPLLRDLRNATFGAGMNVEGAKGECNLGQFEIGFLYDDVLLTADNHAVYKTIAKEIAAQHGKAITFMPKFDEREGNSCHIHLSLRHGDGSVAFWEDGGRSAIYEHFIAGLLASLAELTLMYAPNVNSYKRFAPGSFAPTAISWGNDNRTCALRLVGTGASARVENRVPGGDANPYLALAAMLGAGLYGIEHELPLEPETRGNAYHSAKPTVPTTLRQAREAFHRSDVARTILGDDVVDHYTNMADVELAAFDSAVTDWELRRTFERF